MGFRALSDIPSELCSTCESTPRRDKTTDLITVQMVYIFKLVERKGANEQKAIVPNTKVPPYFDPTV